MYKWPNSGNSGVHKLRQKEKEQDKLNHKISYLTPDSRFGRRMIVAININHGKEFFID